jgi:putative ABC transport system permease protein
LTQNNDYTIIDMQLEKTATDQTVSSIRVAAGPSLKIYDKRQSNTEARAMFYSMGIFVYGFLMVIALITIINIINNMNSSVAVRLNYYGIMMAVGMSIKQIRKMIVVEAATYAICGCLLGCVVGIPIHKFLFEVAITYHWAIKWTLPTQSLMIILSITIITTMTSIIWPVKKISQMDIVKVVNAN